MFLFFDKFTVFFLSSSFFLLVSVFNYTLQETVGYFFCLEDRALLCRKCDVAIHTANSFVCSHQRFLLTGVKVGLEPTEPGGSSSSGKSVSGVKRSETKSHSVSRRENLSSLAGLPGHVGGVQDFVPSKVSFSGGSVAGSIPQWHIDEFIGLTDFSQNYEFMGNGSSKVCFPAIPQSSTSHWSCLFP